MAFEGCEKEVMVCSWPLRKDGEQMRQTWLLKRRVKINCEGCDTVLAGGRVSVGYSLGVGPKGLALVRFHVNMSSQKKKICEGMEII